MSEFWVSKKKYWCKYCETHIADDAPSRSQHENGLRHKGNKERFVRGLYKQAEQKKKDEADERREMARVDQAARAAFAGDVTSGNAKASSPSLPAPRPSATASAAEKQKGGNLWANYSTAASLGIDDPDAERAAAEAERHRTQGVAGDWQFVQTVPLPLPHPSDALGPEAGGGSGVGVAGDESRKREAEPLVDEDDMRAFKVRKKTWGAAGGLGDLWEGDIPIKLKDRNAALSSHPGSGGVQAALSAPVKGLAPVPSGPQATEMPKWTPRNWTVPGSSTPADSPELTDSAEERKPDVDSSPPVSHATTAKLEEPGSVKVGNGLPTVKSEGISVKTEEPVVGTEDPIAAAPTGMFRKRKAPAASAGSRARR